MNSRKGLFQLIICIVIPLIVGGISLVLSSGSFLNFDVISRPRFTPPNWLFPVIWVAVYIFMGIALYLIHISESQYRKPATVLFIIQLALAFCWNLLFFNTTMHWFAFVWLLIMWILIIIMMNLTLKFSWGATLCLLPLILWITFAAFMNLMIARLN